MALEVTGSIYRIDPEEAVSALFKKRQVIIKTDENYPQFIAVEFQQDRVDLLDPYQVGQNVTISLNLAGRLWTNPQGEEKCFNTIKGWKVQKVGTVPTPAAIPPATAYAPALPNNTAAMNEEEASDLPF